MVVFHFQLILGFGTIGKVFLTFEKQFWSNEVQYILLTRSLPGARESATLDEIFQTTVYTPDDAAPNTLLAWVGLRASKENPTL